MASRAPPRRYMELLTPLLHRRFVKAVGIALGICYIESILVGGSSSWFWSWFPIGWPGTRALLLVISSIVVFLLRFEQRHIGAHNSTSPIAFFAQVACSPQIPQTLLCYVFSAWWFSEVYFWSAPDTADLGWISAGKLWERNRLNERPIYLRCIFYGLAGLQTFLHIYFDHSRFPFSSLLIDSSTERPPLGNEQSPIKQLLDQALPLVRDLVFQATCVALAGPLIYALFLRRYAWAISYRVASSIWDLPATGNLSYIPPYHITLIFRSFVASFLLLSLWQSSNLVFSAYLKQLPIKNGAPLSDISSDPNGTLLKGLTAKRELPSNFAFLELSLISQDYGERRQTIFADIDRPTGPMWTQVMNLCLGRILAVSSRISENQRPSQQSQIQAQPTQATSLRRITPPLRQDPIMSAPATPTNRREKVQYSIGTFAKSLGDSPKSPSPSAKQYLESARSKLLTQSQQQTLSIEGVKSEANPYIINFLKSPLGWPFRQTFARRARSAIFASPYSDVETILNAMESISRLAVGSLKEDSYGKVAQDVPLIIRVFMSTLDALGAFTQSTNPHWTDVSFQGNRKVEHVEALESYLRIGLRRLIDSFESYAGELGLSVEEVKKAQAYAEIESAKR